MGKHDPRPGGNTDFDALGQYKGNGRGRTDIESDISKAKRKYPRQPVKLRRKNSDEPTENFNAGLLKRWFKK